MSPSVPNLHLERLTSPEAGAAIAAGMTTVIFACGAVEQHGPHLPMFTDAEHGTALAEAVARRLGNALVAPTVRVGCSDHHLAFPGSLSIRATTLEATCHDYCVSLAHHGVRRIGIIPSHGGNFAPLRDMLPRLQEAVAPRCEVRAFTDLVGFVDVWRETVQAVAGLGARVGGHADIAESSVMLALHPALVHVDRAVEGLRGEMDEAAIQRMIRDGLHTVTPNGVIGDAHGMSAAIGERCIAAAAERIAELFR